MHSLFLNEGSHFCLVFVVGKCNAVSLVWFSGEEFTFERNGVWSQEQKGRTARLEKLLRGRWELDEIIEEQVNRFHAHYNMDMVPNRLKDISQLLMPNWTQPDELASIGWLVIGGPLPFWTSCVACLLPVFHSLLARITSYCSSFMRFGSKRQ